MPGLDRRGPEGEGPRTGRQMGKCKPGKTPENEPQNGPGRRKRFFSDRPDGERGLGRRYRAGDGGGRGYGQRNGTGRGRGAGGARGRGV